MIFSQEKYLQKNIVRLLEFFKEKDKIILDYYMIPNDIHFNLSKKEAAIYTNFLKSMGLRNGASDLVVICRKKIFYLELKKLNGKQREEQVEFQENINKCEVAIYLKIDNYDKQFLMNLFKNEA